MSSIHSNSTALNAFYAASLYINEICTNELYCVMFCLCILSFIWSIYYIFRLIKEKKYLKRLHGMERESWLTKKKNSERKILKNKFLIAISTIEWMMMLSICSIVIYNDLRKVLSLDNRLIPKIDLTNCLYNTLSGKFISKLLITFIITMFLLLITLIRILTQYLCEQYSFYPDSSFNLNRILKCRIAVLIFFFLIGLIRQMIIFQWIIGCIILSQEFVCFAKSSNQLNNWLKKRSFDASKHEYQTRSIIKYYKWVHFEYRLSSYLLVTSFFIHTFDLVGFTIFSFFWLILSSPSNWIGILFLNDKVIEFDSLPEHYQQQLNIFATVFSNLELTSLCVGWSLVVIPYVIVSLNKFLRGINKAFTKNKDYPNHELIQALIDHQYKAYTRC